MEQAGQDDSFDFDEAGTTCLQEFQRPRGNPASEEALHIRDTAGEVPRQYDHVCRGLRL